MNIPTEYQLRYAPRSPHASTAAMKRASLVTPACPTAYTLRYMR